MSEVAERNFNNFELGDNVYELADGLIPDIAGHLDVELGEEPSSDELFGLVGKLGKNRVLREGEEVTAIDIVTAAALLDRSGVQESLDRSLWSPEPIDDGSGITMVTGGVANWQDRTAKLVASKVAEGFIPRRIHAVTGNRVMDTKTEITNPQVEEFVKTMDRHPTETEYTQAFVAPLLRAAGADVSVTSYDTKNGDTIAKNFVQDHRELFVLGSPATFARVANAGIQFATQFRNAVRTNVLADYDGYPYSPEVFIRTDTFPIASTPEEVTDPANFQSPYTGLRQAVLTAKMLHEAASA